MKSKEFTAGEKVFFYHSSTYFCNEGTVKKMTDETVTISWTYGGTSEEPIKRVFKTNEECLKYASDVSNSFIKKCKSKMLNMDSLVEFCISHISIDDGEIRQAISERYAELKNAQSAF